MAERFTRADVTAIAALANLELDDAELDLFARQLGDILTYAEEVQRLDTTGVPPTANIVAGFREPAPASRRDREDVERPGLDREAALANAPDPSRQAGVDVFYRVPRVIETGGQGPPDTR